MIKGIPTQLAILIIISHEMLFLRPTHVSVPKQKKIKQSITGAVCGKIHSYLCVKCVISMTIQMKKIWALILIALREFFVS